MKVCRKFTALSCPLRILTHDSAGKYAQDVWTIKSIYIDGKAPKSVSLHWRRFAVADIPTDEKEFQLWLEQRWREKDQLLEYFEQNGRFPADEEATVEHVPVPNGAGINTLVKSTSFVETTVRPGSYLEVIQIYGPVLALGLILHLIWRLWNWLLVALSFRVK